MIFARLEQITPTCTSNEPYLFCRKCHAYYFGEAGKYCSICGHKFKKEKEPKIITVKREKEMSHEAALNYVFHKLFAE